MRRKYFMRGLGVGVIMTALIFTLALTFRKETISNAEVRKRAEEMGMIMPQAQTMGDNISSNENVETTVDENGDTVTVENKTGADVTDDTTDPATEANGGNPNPTAPTSPTSPTNPTATQAPAGPGTGGNTNATGNNNTVNVNSGNIVKFIVREGESSSIVGANLYRAGLVDSATDFNTFLESNGYDTVLHVGEFDLRTGSSYETLAKTLTGR